MREIKQSDPDFRFQVGDVCKMWGVPCIVEGVQDYGVGVLTENKERAASFYPDGRESEWHKEPSLIFVSRPKKKVKKTVEMWLVMNDKATIEYDSYRVFKSDKDASDWLFKWESMPTGRLVKFTAEVEVEEEEQ